MQWDGRIGVAASRGDKCAHDVLPRDSFLLYALDVHERAYHADTEDLEDVWGEHGGDDEEEEAALERERESYVRHWAEKVNWAVLNDVYARHMKLAEK